MACHGVISAGFGRNRFCIKLEITPPSISNHSRYGTFFESFFVNSDRNGALSGVYPTSMISFVIAVGHISARRAFVVFAEPILIYEFHEILLRHRKQISLTTIYVISFSSVRLRRAGM